MNSYKDAPDKFNALLDTLDYLNAQRIKQGRQYKEQMFTILAVTFVCLPFFSFFKSAY